MASVLIRGIQGRDTQGLDKGRMKMEAEKKWSHQELEETREDSPLAPPETLILDFWLPEM